MTASAPTLVDPGVALTDVIVDADMWTAAIEDLESLSEQAAQAAWAEFDAEVARGAAPAGRRALSPVAIAFLDDAAQRALNACHRGVDKPTNVLAFEPAPGPEQHLGDISIAFETVAAEARSAGTTLRDRTAHMIVHAMFHLFGYTHDNDADALTMERAEAAALARLGVSDPYEDLSSHA